MANWLQKIMLPQRPNGRGLVERRPGSLQAARRGAPPSALPNASIIYGVAASAFFVIGLYFLIFERRWVAGLLMMLPAGCFLGFALHLMKHSR